MNRIKLAASAKLPTPWGIFTLVCFEEIQTKKEHLALVFGEPLDRTKPVLTRIHSECLTGDALFSLRCDCGSQLETAMQAIAHSGQGVLLYMRQEGRGIGLVNKIKAYALQDAGMDTVEANQHLGFDADLRDYQLSCDMLKKLQISHIRLMTNNPKKVAALEENGIIVSERVAHQCGHNPYNDAYLETKEKKLGHLS